MTKLAYSVKEAAEAAGLSASSLDRAIAAGDLAAKLTTDRTVEKPRGGKRVILSTELQRYLDNLPDA